MSLDTYTQNQYISTPILFRVDMAKTTMAIRDSDNKVDTALRASMPLFPEAPRTVADLALISTNRSTDLIALVKAVSDETRKTKAGDDVTDVTLVDNTLTDSEKLATIDVSVFGASKIEQLRQAVGTPMAFFNLSIVCKRGDKPEVCHYLTHRKSQLRQSAPRRWNCARKVLISRHRLTSRGLPEFGNQIKHET